MSPRSGTTRELTTVLFTDVVDSTQRLAENGDRLWAGLLDALDAVTLSETRRRGGELIKSTGDGALLLLPGPTVAVECAVALHAAAGGLGVVLRIGAHTGEIERRGADVAGMAVHVAARLMNRAGPGETLVSATVQSLATSPDTEFEDRGRLTLKGVAEPTPAFAVLSAAPAPPAPAPVVSSAQDPLARLLDAGRFEEAAVIVGEVADVAGIAGALLSAHARVAFLDVDVTLVRMLEDVLDRLPEGEAALRSRVAAKLAFELRGDPATVVERRELLESATAEAHRVGDERAETDALLATIHALWEPAGADDRLEAAERTIMLARRTHAVEQELEGRLARVHALIEVGRAPEAEIEVGAYARLAAPLDRPDLRVFVASRRALLALMTGRYDEAREQVDIANSNALIAGMPDAGRLEMSYRFLIDRDTGEGVDLWESSLEGLRSAARFMPGHYFEALLARTLLRLGRIDEARLELSRVMPSLLNSSGYRWLFAACDAADVAAAVGADETCSRLYDALEPHDGRLVVLGPAFYGAVGDRLGVLAKRLGRLDDAVAHCRQAVRDLDAIAALPWAAWARLALADALRAAGDHAAADQETAAALETARALGMRRLLAEVEPRSRASWTLRRDGDDWLLETGTERGRFRAARGFEHLRVLLANPGQDVAAHRLDVGDGTVPVPRESGVPMLDEQALAAYRRRLVELQDEADAADRAGDQQRADRLDAERSQILAQVRKATGLAGRPRRIDDAGERARVNVTRNIKRALDQIQQATPLAGAHLVASIRTGSQCRYEPAPGGPDRWDIPAS